MPSFEQRIRDGQRRQKPDDIPVHAARQNHQPRLAAA